MSKKKKLLIMSDSYCVYTGFANVGRHVADHLHKSGKYDIAYLCWFHAPLNNIVPPFTIYTTLRDHSKCCGRGPAVMKMEPGKAPIYLRHQQGVLFPLNEGQPCFQGNNMEHDKYAYESLHGTILDFQPDIIWSVSDCWMQFHYQFMDIRESFKYYSYFPIDGTPMPHLNDMGPHQVNWVDTINKADKAFAFCEFGRDAMIKTGALYGTDLRKVGVINHGADTNNYRPLEDKSGLKKRLFNLEKETFLVGCFSRNQPRKAFHKLMEAIALGKRKGYWNGDTIKCYFHCPIKDVGWNLPDLIKTHNIEDIIILDPKLQVGMGPTDEQMNELYNACDLMTLPSRGEGWGLCGHKSLILHTLDKVKTFETVEIDDMILSRDGTYHKILDKTTRDVNKLYEVKAFYVLPTKMTEEHPYLVSRDGTFETLDWMNVKDIHKGDYLFFPKPKYDNILPEIINIKDYVNCEVDNDGLIYKKMGFSPNRKLSYSTICSKYNESKKVVEKTIKYIKGDKSISSERIVELSKKLLNDPEFSMPTPIKINSNIIVNDDFLEFCGWYLAEGSSDGNRRLELDLHIDEKPIAERLGKWASETFQCEYVIEQNGENKCRLRISSSIIAEFFSTFLGYGCENKFIPWVLENGGNKLSKLISGLFHGDGHFNEELKHISLHTTSQSLFIKCRDILASQSILSSMNKCTYREGYKQAYKLIIARESLNKFNVFIGDKSEFVTSYPIKDMFKESEDGYLIKVTDISISLGTETVYDICVEDTHDFVANGVLVHNTYSEAMSAGVPVLMSAYSAHHDWAEHAAARIKIAALDSEPLTNIDRAIVDVEDYCEKIKAFYDNISLEEFEAKFGPVKDYRDEKNV